MATTTGERRSGSGAAGLDAAEDPPADPAWRGRERGDTLAEVAAEVGEENVTGIIHAPWLLAEADGDDLLAARIEAIERLGEEIFAPLTP